MTDTVTVIVNHHLGKAEALRRVKEGLAHASAHGGPMMAIDQQSWEGDTLRFGMRAVGQAVSGTIHVLEDALRIEVTLPWLLAKLAKRLAPMVSREATLLLEKK